MVLVTQRLERGKINRNVGTFLEVFELPESTSEST